LENSQRPAAPSVQLRPRKSRRVEPGRGARVGNTRIADDIGARAVTIAEVCVPAADRQRRARSRLLGHTKVPGSYNRVQQAPYIGTESSAMANRNLPEQGRKFQMSEVERGPSAVVPCRRIGQDRGPFVRAVGGLSHTPRKRIREGICDARGEAAL